MILATKRLLEVETRQKQLENDIAAFRAHLDSERVELANLKEQTIRAINRLRQREVRGEPKEPNGEPAPKPISPLAAAILRGSDVVLPR